MRERKALDPEGKGCEDEVGGVERGKNGNQDLRGGIYFQYKRKEK